MSLPEHEATVLPEWIDSNGHMNLAYYILVFDQATDLLFDTLGIGAEYRQATGNSCFAVETHTLYEKELKAGERVRIKMHVLGADTKRLHYFLEMFHAETRERVAAHEIMTLHIDMSVRRVAPFPADRQAQLRAAVEEQAQRPVPKGAGRRIEMLD